MHPSGEGRRTPKNTNEGIDETPDVVKNPNKEHPNEVLGENDNGQIKVPVGAKANFRAEN